VTVDLLLKFNVDAVYGMVNEDASAQEHSLIRSLSLGGEKAALYQAYKVLH
jgi:hypothetical protein